MNAALVGAAGLIFAVGVAHSYLGERYILTRLFRRPDLPQLFGSDIFTRRTLRFAWHVTTVTWWGVATLLLLAARVAPEALPLAEVGAVVSGTALASAIVSLVGSRGRHLSWLAFLVVAVLTWWGSH